MAAKLPKRFQPFLAQALTEADLRYGAQESAFGTVLGQLGRDRDRQLLAQKTAQQSLLGSMQQSDNNVNRYYTDAGLTPSVLQSLAGSNTGARLAGEMAGYRSQNAQNAISAQAGGQYQQQRINQDFGDKRQTLVDQLNAEQRERGTFTSSALEQLITGDRATRHAANVEAAKQQHADAQAILDRAAAQDNAYVGQGLQVGPDGKLIPLPGGKADPNAPQFQKDPPKPKKPPKPSGVDRTIQGDYKKAAAWVKQLDEKTAAVQPDPAKRRAVVEELLIKGDQVSGIPSITSAGLDAALDMYYNQALSADTVAAMHSAGAKVKFLNGTQTQAQRDAQGRKNAHRKVTRPEQAVPGLGGAAPAAPTPDQADRNRKR